MCYETFSAGGRVVCFVVCVIFRLCVVLCVLDSFVWRVPYRVLGCVFYIYSVWCRVCYIQLCAGCAIVCLGVCGMFTSCAVPCVLCNVVCRVCHRALMCV